MIRLVKTWLTHPLTRGLNINDPRTTFLRRRILTEKKFLRLIYDEWYRSVAEGLPPGNGPVLELGTGAGFLDEMCDNSLLRPPDAFSLEARS